MYFKSFLWLLWGIFLNNLNLCYSFNILVLFGHPGKSHFDVFSDLFLELAYKGHNVTVISHVNINTNSKNLRQIHFRDKPMLHVMNLNQLGQQGFSYYYIQPIVIADFAKDNCEYDLSTPQFQNFLKEDHQFDVILGEMFNTNCYNGLIRKLNTPFIGLSSCTHFSWQADWFGISANPSYMQHIFGGFKTPMTFLSRVENTLIQIYANLWYKFGMERPGNVLSKKYIGYEPVDPHNASLLLVNTHHTFDGARPLTPSVVEVGGIHISNKKPQKLPKDIENWINNSSAGVVYFNLGSMIKSDTFPEEQRRAFARAFAKLPQRVLWKWENDTMPDKPDNVMIAKWMPQFDILSHPNVKLFISHGGLLGTTEAVHCGVPIVVMPQFGDQNHNAHAIENNGVGVRLHLQSATEEKVAEALKKTLDPRTFANAKALSARFRDRPLSPMDTAVYWIEHVARHKGARHMRSAAIDLPIYQYLLLDVFAFLGLITLISLYIAYKVARFVLSLVIYSIKPNKEKVQ